MDGIFKIEMRGKFSQIVSILIHIVTIPGLGRTPMATPVMGDHTKSFRPEEQHLILKRICRQRPTMTEDNGLSTSPVFKMQIAAVFQSKFVVLAHEISCRGTLSCLTRPQRALKKHNANWRTITFFG